MDLRNLLNQKEENTGLTLDQLQSLLTACDNAQTLEKITNATFTFPSQTLDSFKFFNVFIQLLLSIEQDLYDANYTRTIMIDSLRTCINGLLRQFGMNWLLDFPQHFNDKTWISLHSSSDTSILIYLYGLVLALVKKPDILSTSWIHGLVNFIQSDTHEIITHLWLSVCAMDETEYRRLFLDSLETRLKKTGKPAGVRQTLALLQSKDAEFLASRVNQQLGNALARPPFTEDEFVLGLLELENFCQSNQGLTYPRLFSIFVQFKSDDSLKTNPLLSHSLLLFSPSDDRFYAQSCLSQCSTFWIQKMGDMIPDEFDRQLKNLILKHYPTEKKTNLDMVLADWALRDRFKRHRDLIIDTIIQLLKKPRYNNRTAPFYALIQLFYLHPPVESDGSYKIKSGALIDQSAIYKDQEQVDGCLAILKRITKADTDITGKLDAWIGDCLRVSPPEVAQRYIEWLCQRGTNQQKTMRFLSTALRETSSHAFYTVPIFLRSFDDNMLTWLLKPANAGIANDLLTRYFGDGPQVSKHILVRDLLTHKSKEFMDKLLGFLRNNLFDTSPSSTRSRKWFRNHFLGPLLWMAGDEQGSKKNVASRIFSQFFKTRQDFEWYFQTPLVEQQLPFDFLDLSKSHDIYSVRYMGLASVLQEMAQLGENGKKKNLVKMWFDLWTAPSQGSFKFTVPISWVLQCAGLYDQAPVLVKQMIEQFIKIGMASEDQQQEGFLGMVSERKFVDRMMDLVLLSDTPEPDSLFDLFLTAASDRPETLEQIMNAIISILVEISEELEVESNFLLMPVQPRMAQQTRHVKKNAMQKRNVKKMRKVLMKQQAELEESLQKTLKSGDRSTRALSTLVQRLINFLLSLLNHTDTSVIKQQIQHRLTHMPLFYEPLAKLANSIRQPEELQEDIQTTIEISLNYLKTQSKDKKMLEIAQNILQMS